MGKSTATHLLLDWFGCDQSITNNAENLCYALLQAAQKANCRVLHTYYYQFEPQGSTAIIVLAESHISAHSTPEEDKINIDIFTCGDGMMPYKAMDYLRETLKPTSYEVNAQRRL